MPYITFDAKKFNGELTIHGELLKSITVNHIKLFAVKNGDKFSVYAEHVSQVFIHKMTFCLRVK